MSNPSKASPGRRRKQCPKPKRTSQLWGPRGGVSNPDEESDQSQATAFGDAELPGIPRAKRSVPCDRCSFVGICLYGVQRPNEWRFEFLCADCAALATLSGEAVHWLTRTDCPACN